jgi:hypothetical protein
LVCGRYSYLHHAVDDAYSEILTDERKETGQSVDDETHTTNPKPRIGNPTARD